MEESGSRRTTEQVKVSESGRRLQTLNTDLQVNTD